MCRALEHCTSDLHSGLKLVCRSISTKLHCTCVIARHIAMPGMLLHQGILLWHIGGAVAYFCRLHYCIGAYYCGIMFEQQHNSAHCNSVHYCIRSRTIFLQIAYCIRAYYCGILAEPVQAGRCRTARAEATQPPLPTSSHYFPELFLPHQFLFLKEQFGNAEMQRKTQRHI